MIRNQNGTPYTTAGSIQQFDPENPEHCLFNDWDSEIIRQAGSPIYYYEVLIQDQTIDPVYLEDRGKMFSNFPIELYAIYEPIPSQNSQGLFGIDGSMDEQMFELNYKEVLGILGHPPKIGSRLYTPHLKENWVIVQRNTGEYKLWGTLRLQLFAKKFQESTTTGDGKVTQPKQDFDII